MWQPIETAPKDGRHVLLWFPDCRCAFACVWDEGFWFWDIAGGGEMQDMEAEHGKASQWHPMPERPA